MKSIAIVLLTLILLLTGCMADQPEPTLPSTTAAAPTEPGLYEPNSALEASTAGAVSTYGKLKGDSGALLGMSGGVLVFAYREQTTTITRLTGQKGHPVHSAQLEGLIDPKESQMRAFNNVLAYYSGDTNTIRILDSMLRVTGSFSLPEEIPAPPVLSADLKRAYYAIGHEVRYLDLNTGLAGLLRSQETQQLIPLQMAASDSSLVCRKAQGGILGISTRDGRTLAEGQELTLTAYEDRYFAVIDDGPEYLFGSAEGDMKALYLQPDQCFPLLEENILVCFEATDEGVQADAYSLDSGLRIASVRMPGLLQAYSPVSDSKQGVWFLGVTGEDTILCRWDLTMSEIKDETSYAGQRFTQANPDRVGLEQCARRAEELSDRYGMNICLWDNGTAPEGYSFQETYKGDPVKETLDTLEQILPLFPEDFFRLLDEEGLTVELVRKIETDLADADPELGSLAYWQEGRGVIALACGDDTADAFYGALSNILDAYIYSKSLKYDDWNSLNPAGFAYDGSYDLYADREDVRWLEGESRAFVDSYAITFAREDRSRIFTCAMTENCEDVFAAPIMQKKLERMCLALRDAFGWKKDERSFHWEQYLNA